jgi:hypothetical protein
MESCSESIARDPAVQGHRVKKADKQESNKLTNSSCQPARLLPVSA